MGARFDGVMMSRGCVPAEIEIRRLRGCAIGPQGQRENKSCRDSHAECSYRFVLKPTAVTVIVVVEADEAKDNAVSADMQIGTLCNAIEPRKLVAALRNHLVVVDR